LVTQQPQTVVSNGSFRFEVYDNWLQLPDDWDLQQIVGVAVDSSDRLFVFSRSDHPLTIFSPDGSLVASWDHQEFTRPHGVFIDPHDRVFLTDDMGHSVRCYSIDGELQMTLGTPGVASPTGVRDCDYRTMDQAAGPFNLPTNVAISPEGDLYVCDGYGNARVHHFDAEGTLIASWGEPGDGPGQFHVPHGVRFGPDGLLYVSDRENSRVQKFTPGGEVVGEWSGLARPCEVVFDQDNVAYVIEIGFRCGLFAGHHSAREDKPGGRLSVLDQQGKVLAQFGGGETPDKPGDFYAPHDLAIDSKGDLYIGEVRPGAGRFGEVLSDQQTKTLSAPLLQKFVRV
jgi:DNA-binding beta-propeller fold protein YncE